MYLEFGQYLRQWALLQQPKHVSPDVAFELLGHCARQKQPSCEKLLDGNLRLKFRWLGGVKLLCSPSIQNYWPDGFWLGKRKVNILDFLVLHLVSALFLACLIFFPLPESLAIGSASFSATVSLPRTDLSAILISLFRRFSFALKLSQRWLALLVS